MPPNSAARAAGGDSLVRYVRNSHKASCLSPGNGIPIVSVAGSRAPAIAWRVAPKPGTAAKPARETENSRRVIRRRSYVKDYEAFFRMAAHRRRCEAAIFFLVSALNGRRLRVVPVFVEVAPAPLRKAGGRPRRLPWPRAIRSNISIVSSSACFCSRNSAIILVKSMYEYNCRV